MSSLVLRFEIIHVLWLLFVILLIDSGSRLPNTSRDVNVFQAIFFAAARLPRENEIVSPASSWLLPGITPGFQKDGIPAAQRNMECPAGIRHERQKGFCSPENCNCLFIIILTAIGKSRRESLMNKISVLLISGGDACIPSDPLYAILSEAGDLEVSVETSLEGALAHIESGDADIIILRAARPFEPSVGFPGILARRFPNIPLILVADTEEEAISLTGDNPTHNCLMKDELTPGLVKYAIGTALKNKQAVKALRESEERFQSLIENSSDHFWIMDLAGSFKYASPSVMKMRGFTSEEMLLGQRLQDVLTPESVKIVNASMQNFLDCEKAGIPYEGKFIFELEAYRKDGSTLWTETVVNPLKNEKNETTAILGVTRDIMERKAGERALREATTQWNSTFNAIRDAICLVDLEGRILRCNDSMAEIVGKSRDEIIGEHCFRLMHGTEGHIAECPLRRLRETRQRENLEITMGEKRVEISVDPLLDDVGNLIGGVHIISDITARKHAEEALRKEKDRAQTYLDTAAIMVLALDSEGCITKMNKKGHEILGYDDGELIGRNWFETCLPIHAREELSSVFRRNMNGEATFVEYYENPVVTKSGHERLIAWHNALLSDENGRAYGTLSSGMDITEHRLAEDALRESEERFRQFFENDPAYCYRISPEGVILDVNRSALQALGYKKKELLGKPLKPLYAQESPERMEELSARWKETGYLKNEEIIVCTKDGRRRIVLLSANQIRDREGNLLHTIAVQWDITEKRDLEEQFRQAQKMEAIGRLAGGMAHDFNNILMAVMGNCELILSDLREADPMREDVLQIRECAVRAASLTRRLLIFSRRRVLEPINIDLNEIVSGMDELLRRVIGEDIELLTTLARQPVTVRVDPGDMEQIILNVVINARDAMPRGGRLTIETGKVFFDEEYTGGHAFIRPGPYVMLAISDTGCGMDRETLKKIFEPFFTTKETGKGTGLGLATVYGMVKQSEGHIQVSSEVGAGTTLKIYLPLAREKSKRVKSQDVKEKIKRGIETILVVEDEKSVRHLVMRILRNAGYTVLEARGGGEALLLCEKHDGPIALVISDVVMPRMSGRELVERLKSTRPEMKALFMSGYTDDAVTRHGIVENQTPFLQKPFSATDILRKVRAILDRRSRR